MISQPCHLVFRSLVWILSIERTYFEYYGISTEVLQNDHQSNLLCPVFGNSVIHSQKQCYSHVYTIENLRK